MGTILLIAIAYVAWKIFKPLFSASIGILLSIFKIAVIAAAVLYIARMAFALALIAKI